MRLIAYTKRIKAKGRRRGQTVKVRQPGGRVVVLRSGDQIVTTIFCTEQARTVFPPWVEPHPTQPGFAKADESNFIWEVV